MQAPKDQMTPLERMAAFARGMEIDRLPCAPIIGEHACRLTGVTVRPQEP